MEDLFANPFWHALNTEHAGIALGAGLARRYPAEILPFAGLAEDTPEALSALLDLLGPGEQVFTTGDTLPRISGLEPIGQIPGLQMHFHGPIPEPENTTEIHSLTQLNDTEMVRLTDIAFPGFFRIRTCELGLYFGIRHQDALVAMAGERFALPGYREISAVCTHPAHTGKGYAAHLIRHLLRSHAQRGLKSFLHVSAGNDRAIGLYERLGFTRTRTMLFHHLRRS